MGTPKIMIIGDSHIIRMRKTLRLDIPVNECYWDKEPYPENYEKPTCAYAHVFQGGYLSEDVYFSSHHGRSAWSSSKVFNEMNPCLKKIIKDDTLILASFGYIDCKVQLVNFKDAEKTVIRYMDEFQKAFPNNKIRYIEPIPQFVNNLGTGPEIFDFKDRYPMHRDFIYYLKKHSKERGLEAPISPERLLGVDKFDESYECHDCAYCLSPESTGIRWDHLKAYYNNKILKDIFSQYGIVPKYGPTDKSFDW